MRLRRGWPVVAGALCLTPSVAYADDGPIAQIQRIVVDGTDRDQVATAEAKVIEASTGTVVTVSRSLLLSDGDEIVTGANVSAEILLLQGAVEEDKTVLIGPASQVRLQGPTSIFAAVGRLLSNVRGLFEIGLPSHTLRAKGTEFEVRVTGDGTADLVVLEGTVSVSDPTGAPAGGTAAAPTELRVSGSAGAVTSTTRPLGLRNGCTLPHTYDFAAPDNLPWLSAVQARVEVPPGETRRVALGLRVDARRLAVAAYRGDLIVRCLDCEAEPDCGQESTQVPIVVIVQEGPAQPAGGETAAGGSVDVGSLQEMKLQKAARLQAPQPASEDGVRGIIDWSSDRLLAGRPIYAQEGVVPLFTGAEERSQAFREARFQAVWRKDAASYATLGRIRADWGEGAKAVRALERARAIDPALDRSPRFLTDLGKGFRAQGELDRAEAPMRKALQIAPDFAPAHNALGNLQLDRAEAARTGGDSTAQRRFLEAAVGSFRRFEATARRDVEREIARANQGEALVARGELALREGRGDEARASFERARLAFEESERRLAGYPYAQSGLGDAYRGLARSAKATGDARSAGAYYGKAEEWYRRAAEMEPRIAAPHRGMAALYAETGKDDLARESYKRAARAQPRDPGSYYGLGELEARGGRGRDAAKYMAAFLALESAPRRQGERARVAQDVVRGSTAAIPATPPAPAPWATRAPLPPTPGVSVKVPGVKGDSFEEATRKLERAGLRAVVSERPSCDNVGKVLEQTPEKNAVVPAGSGVRLIVGASGRTVVPSVTGWSQKQAESALRSQGFDVQASGRQTTTHKPGTVVAQRPEGGRPLARGCPVRLEVAVAVPRVIMPSYVNMPALVGRTTQEAFSLLKQLGLLASALGRGQCVVKQSPAPRTRLRRGQGVSIGLGDCHVIR